jgi:hypothetical protein
MGLLTLTCLPFATNYTTASKENKQRREVRGERRERRDEKQNEKREAKLRSRDIKQYKRNTGNRQSCVCQSKR